MSDQNQQMNQFWQMMVNQMQMGMKYMSAWSQMYSGQNSQTPGAAPAPKVAAPAPKVAAPAPKAAAPAPKAAAPAPKAAAPAPKVAAPAPKVAAPAPKAAAPAPKAAAPAPKPAAPAPAAKEAAKPAGGMPMGMAGLFSMRKATPQKEIKVSDFDDELLTQEDLNEIVSRYGGEIENIYELAPGQRWMFERAQHVTNAFFLQALFKAKIKIKPWELRRKLDEVVEKRDNLHTAFVWRGVSHPYRVVLKKRQAEMHFLDYSAVSKEELDEKLESKMRADRMRGFDLEEDPLLRINVFKTYEEDTYAILVSQPHINSDGVSVALLIKDIFIDYAINLMGFDASMEAQSYKDYAKYLSEIDSGAELEYWKKNLEGVTDEGLTTIPGLSRTPLKSQRVVTKFVPFSQETQVALKKSQKTYKATLNSIMQAAWSLMLMKLYNTQDTRFGSIISGRDAQVAGGNFLAGGFINALCVRGKAEPDQKISDFVSSLQRQFMESMKYSHCSPDEIKDSVGLKGELFDHLLNFHNFMGEGTKGFGAQQTMPGIQMLDSKIYDNLSSDLTVYFQNRSEGFGCNYSYNSNRLSNEKISLLSECFQSVVEQIVAGNEELCVKDIHCPGIEEFQKLDELDELQALESFLKGLPLMKGVSEEAVFSLAEMAELVYFNEDESIYRPKERMEQFYIVKEGFVVTEMVGIDGWTRPLMNRGPGKILDTSTLIPGEFTRFGAHAESTNVTLLSIPTDKMWELMVQYPQMLLNVMKDQQKAMSTYASLWVNND